jgi:hypothetical protein
MEEPIVTFGLLMGLEVESKQDSSADDCFEEALLVFCQTGESEEGKIEITPRMTDLALMGFRPVAITRWDPQDTGYYSIFSTDDLSESLRNAVLNEAGSLVRQALDASEL